MTNRKWRRMIRISCLLAAAVVLSVLVASLVLQSSRAGSQGSKTPTKIRKINVRTFAEGFRVVKFERHNGEAWITLRNDYDKVISSFAYSLQPQDNDTRRFYSIPHGENYLLRVGLMEHVPNSGLPDAERTITILAVTFPDGTGDGNPKIIQEMLDSVLGRSIQAERVNRILEEASIDNDMELVETLDTVAAKIASLPDPPEAEKSWAVRAALRSETEGALMILGQLKQVYESEGIERFKQALEGIKADYRQRARTSK